MQNAVSVKDDILKKLNECETHEQFSEVMPNLLGLLSYGKGFWAELGYCYKAVEIIDRAIYVLDDFTVGLDSLPTYKRVLKDGLTFLYSEWRKKLLVLRREYHTLHLQGKTSS